MFILYGIRTKVIHQETLTTIFHQKHPDEI